MLRAIKAGSRGGKRMARKGDEAYNARRRFTRAAERYLRKADEVSGEASERYKFLAANQLRNAIRTYDPNTKQKLSAPLQKLGERLSIDLQVERRGVDLSENERKRLIDVSESQLEMSLNERGMEQRRQEEARVIFNNDDIGSRILGGTVRVWKDVATVDGKVDRNKIMPALYEHFNVDNYADLLLKVEDMIGADKLYAQPGNDVMYESVKLMLQKRIRADNSVVE